MRLFSSLVTGSNCWMPIFVEESFASGCASVRSPARAICRHLKMLNYISAGSYAT